MTLNTILFTTCSWARLREASRDKRTLALLGAFLTTFALHISLAATSSLDHENRVPATQRRDIECSNRGHESCRECLVDRTSQGRLWLRPRSSYTNQGMFPAPLPRSAPGSHIVRSRRRMNWITPSLGYSALISAEYLTRGRMERHRASSVSLCTM